MQSIRYALDADGIATATFDAPDAPVNTMTREWQADMAALATQLEADKPRIQGVILASAKRTFFAGAALKLVLGLKASDAATVFADVQAMKASFRRIESLGRPVVALLEGSALGGGWEVALIAHARFASRDERTRFGTPEVTLGLIPGATGITKTVRRLGLVKAQPYLLEGRLFGPAEAAELGWIDGFADTKEDLRVAAVAWIADHADASHPWDRRDYRMPGGTPASPAVATALTLAPAMLLRKTRGLYPAPEAILEAMVEGAQVDYDTATRIESRKLAKVMIGQTAKNMITAFFFDRQALKTEAGAPPWQPPAAFVGRLVDAFASEMAAMRDEGIAASYVRHAALAIGMAEQALVSLGSPSPVQAEASGGWPNIDVDALKQRLLYRVSIEAVRGLERGAVASAAEANVASIMGAGFPAWTGGAIQFVASEGRVAFLERADVLARLRGPRFALSSSEREAIPAAG